jgi:predicted secreted Zn-dependent protease
MAMNLDKIKKELEEAEMCDGLGKITINTYGAKIIRKLIDELLTPEECEALSEWAETNMQADLDAYDDGSEIYDMTRKECKAMWQRILKKLKQGQKRG